MGRLEGRVAGFLVGFLVGFGLTGAFLAGALVGFGEGFGPTGDIVGGVVRVGKGIGSIVNDAGEKYVVGAGVFVGKTRGGLVIGIGTL
jgi:hypothetical protein